MSIRSLLMPAVSQRLLSRERLLARRARAERARRARGEPHRVHYFHQVDDPYSALAAAALPALAARYDVEISPHVVGPPPDDAAPERERLVAYSRRDAALLARHLGLEFDAPGTQPPPDAQAANDLAVMFYLAITGGIQALARPSSSARVAEHIRRVIADHLIDRPAPARRARAAAAR